VSTSRSAGRGSWSSKVRGEATCSIRAVLAPRQAGHRRPRRRRLAVAEEPGVRIASEIVGGGLRCHMSSRFP